MWQSFISKPWIKSSPIQCRFMCQVKPGGNAQVLFDPQNRPRVTLDPAKKEELMKESEEQSKLEPWIRSSELRYKRPSRVIEPPEKISATLNRIFRNDKTLGDAVQEYLASGVKFRRVLNKRHPPLEKAVKRLRIEEVKRQFEKDYEEELMTAKVSRQRLKQIAEEIEIKAEQLVMKKSFKWKPVLYDDVGSWAYLLGKAPYDYACALRVFKEIKNREGADFQPRTLFDFGSGVGSNIWAAKEVFGHFTEVFGVDSSTYMNDVAKLVLLDGNSSNSLPAGYFFRMHLPTSHEIKYDLVTSAFTMLDLPSAEERLTTIDSLWRKTEVGGFLVVIEEGTNACFQIMSEIRDYLIQRSHMKFEDENETKEIQGHIYAPCPHHKFCPRYFYDTIPCNFDVMYKCFQLDKLPNVITHLVQRDRYCYVVFKKGGVSGSLKYPRIVSEPMKRNNHIICRLCTHRGKLEEFIAIKSNPRSDERYLYKYVQDSHCGDKLKVNVENNEQPKTGYWSSLHKEQKKSVKEKSNNT